MGMVHAYAKGDLKLSDLPNQTLRDKIKSIAKSMKDSDTTDFAKTKHAGLPEEVPENVEESLTLTDLPNGSEYGYTEDGVVKCVAARNVCVTRMKQDRERNPGRKYQLIYIGELGLQEGDVLEEKLTPKQYKHWAKASAGNKSKKQGGMTKKQYRHWAQASSGEKATRENVDEGVGDTVKIYKVTSRLIPKSFLKNFKNLKGDTGRIIAYSTDKFADVKMLSGHMKGSEMVIPVDMLQTVKESVNEGVRSPSDKEYKVAQNFAKSIGMELDSIGVQRNGNINIKGDVKGKPKEMVISSTGKVVKENQVNEIKSDKDMEKDGLKYAKKKYKYSAKEMKNLASEMLQYIKSGEIDDQASMEAYVDFRNDMMDEACKKNKLKETIRGVVKEILDKE